MAPACSDHPGLADGARPDEAQLDAASLAICRDLSSRLFPWDSIRALELALLKTFCLPSVSALLDRSGEFARRPRKRYDDTGLMVAELLRLGPDSPAGRAVVQRLNRIHAHYAISADDYAYVLSGFVAEPIRWLRDYGWRPLSPAEQQALFRFWDHVGGLMGIEARPRSLEALMALNERVETELFRSAASNRRVADATLTMLLAAWPRPLHRPLAALLRGLLDPGVASSLGWTPAPPWLVGLVRSALRLRSRLLNLTLRLRPPRARGFYSERPTPSYGAGFRLEQLGPPPLLERLNSPRWHGRQRRIGLTGGIASGKSSVGRLLALRGVPVLDADAYAREALAPDSPGARAVLARHGERVRAGCREANNPGLRDGDDGAGPTDPGAAALDRAALARIVFADAEERSWLEQLVHPLVRERFNAELVRLQEAPVVVLMVPLLFEAGLEDLCSEVWLVDCDDEQQLQRLRRRDGLNEAEARARMAAQWPLSRKRRLADRVIDNRGPIAELNDATDRAISAGTGPIS